MDNSLYDNGSNTYDFEGETYANCGWCEARAMCGGFGATILPVIKLDLAENATPEEALVVATVRRDETHDYGDGGVVSYIQAVVDGLVDPEQEEESAGNPLEALLRDMFGAGAFDDEDYDDDESGWLN